MKCLKWTGVYALLHCILFVLYQCIPIRDEKGMGQNQRYRDWIHEIIKCIQSMLILIWLNMILWNLLFNMFINIMIWLLQLIFVDDILTYIYIYIIVYIYIHIIVCIYIHIIVYIYIYYIWLLPSPSSSSRHRPSGPRGYGNGRHGKGSECGSRRFPRKKNVGAAWNIGFLSWDINRFISSGIFLFWMGFL